MNNEQKIQLANLIMSFISENASKTTKDEMPVMIGTLNNKQGINGFKCGEIGHPVFEFKDRYLIYLESNDGKTTVAVPYYKETLSKVIDFI